MRTKGKITTWNDDKGFGFITPSKGGQGVFVHISAFSGRHPKIDQTVTYRLSVDERDRPCAVDATPAGSSRLMETIRNSDSRSIIGAAVFLAAVGIAAVASWVSPIVPALYVVASLATFIAYALDKSAAKAGAWRTKESTLHLLSLAGGWPGALVAQEKLRHKSKKTSFRVVFWITVFLNCAVFLWLLTPLGSARFQELVPSLTGG